MFPRTRFIAIAPLLLLASCQPDNLDVDSAAELIDANELEDAIRELASDEFGGRAPSSPGEQLTIDFLTDRFESLGLEPGNGGSWTQEVPLVEITAAPDANLGVAIGDQTMQFEYGPEFMGWTKRVVEEADVENSEMVFVGYGIVAPEYDWNDYADVDAQGKTVVMLVNDPGYATQDSTLFNGNSMTYYGRWTYKYEEAARQGADAAIIIHETGPAGYPWAVVQNSWSGPQFDLVREDNNMSRVSIEGWITDQVATQLFNAVGQDLDALKQRAARAGFRAVPLSAQASVSVGNSIRRSTSNNVLAVLPGTTRPEEAVIYMAHWDHLGTDPNLDGDQIYNGAVDNATGTAGLLELAKAFAATEPAPERSVLFLAVTAEEQGLLGSAHYASNPTFELHNIAAAVNIDAMNVVGPTRDVTIIGYGNSELDSYIGIAAAEQFRVVSPDPEPEKGFYFRSDHFSFAKVGIPAIYVDAGVEHLEHGEGYVRERMDDYTANRYHKPADEYQEDWDLLGVVFDLQLLFKVGYRISMETTFPNWSEGVAFKAARDSVMAEAGR